MRLPLARRDARKSAPFQAEFLKSFFDFTQPSGIYKYGKNNASSRANSQRPHVVSFASSGYLSYDPSHRSAALRVDLHAKHEVAAFRPARRGAQQPAGCPRTPPQVASTTRRYSGRIGRLFGDSALSYSTTAAFVVRATFHYSRTGGPFDRRWATFPSL